MSLIPARFDGVALAVANIERAPFFYREILGYKQADASDELARFRLRTSALPSCLRARSSRRHT
jgi:hypothetical protein